MREQIRKVLKNCLARMPPVDRKTLVIRSIPYILIAYLCNKLSWLYSCCVGQTMFVRLYVMMTNIDMAFMSFAPSFCIRDILTGMICAAAVSMVMLYKRKNARKYRTGQEYGSARWGTKKDIAPFVDSEPNNNIILTSTESLTMNSRPSQPKYARNKNVIVIGGSGSGKTRFYVKPNLMQMHPSSSYVITDPKMRIRAILSMQPVNA